MLAFFMWPAAEARFAPAQGGAWLLDEGETLAIVSMTFARAGKTYDNNGKTHTLHPFDKKEVQLYVEHGASREITLVGKTVWSREELDSPVGTFTSTGVRFLEGGARMTLGTVRGTRLTLEGITAIHLKEDRSDTVPSQSGDGDFEAALYLGQASTLWGMHVFSDQRLGYRVRFGGRPDEVNAIITTGLKPDDNWMVLLQSSNFITDERDAPEAYKAHLSIVRRLNPILSVELGGYTTYAGRNTVKDSGVKLGFWYEF